MHVTNKCNNSEAPYPTLEEDHINEIRLGLKMFPQSLPCVVQVSKNVVLDILLPRKRHITSLGQRTINKIDAK